VSIEQSFVRRQRSTPESPHPLFLVHCGTWTVVYQHCHYCLCRDDLIAIDDGVEVVYELVEEVVNRATSIVFERYIEAEIYPYAVRDVKESILRIISVRDIFP
jgi:hypothetical protein